MSIANNVDKTKVNKVKVTKKTVNPLDFIFQLKFLQKLTLTMIYKRIRHKDKYRKMYIGFCTVVYIMMAITILGIISVISANVSYNNFKNKYQYTVQGHIERDKVVYGAENSKVLDPREFNINVKDLENGSIVSIVQDKDKKVQSIELPDEIEKQKKKKASAGAKRIIVLIILETTNIGVFMLGYGRKYCEYYKRVINRKKEALEKKKKSERFQDYRF